MNISVDIFEPVLSFGIVAEKIDISVQTIRFYEQKGLILPYKTKTGQRLYSFHDLYRLQCIRKMITEHGINMAGIIHLISLIPCWEYKGSLDEECKKCPAYFEAVEPCWNIKEVGSKCRNADCRNCPVYHLDITSEELKNIIFKHS